MRNYLVVIYLIILPFNLKAQQQGRDTLFIKDYSNLFKKVQNPETKSTSYLIKDLDNDSEYISFYEKKKYTKIKTTSKIYSLKRLLKKSNSYKRGKLKDDVFFKYLSSFKKFNKYFIINSNGDFIEVDIVISVE